MPIYTSYKVMRRRKHCRKDTEARVELGTRMRAMYLGLGMDRDATANFLQISSRTLHNWETGKHVIPFAAYKLLRLLNRMELPGPSWAGWSFHTGKLWTPEGHGFSGTDGSWWSLLVRRAAMFDKLYAENIQLRKKVVDAQRPPGRGAVDAGLHAASDPRSGDGAKRRPNLLIPHFRTENTMFGAKSSYAATTLVVKSSNTLVATNKLST